MQVSKDCMVMHRYSSYIRGLAAHFPPEVLDALVEDETVDVVPDMLFLNNAPNHHRLNAQPNASFAPTNPKMIRKFPTNIARLFPNRGPIDMCDFMVNCSKVHVCVFDTAVDRNHPDLNVASTICSKSQSSCAAGAHGTHIAGTIAAHGAINGVAPHSILHSFQVCSSTTGSCYLSDILAAFDLAIRWNNNDNQVNRCDVINLGFSAHGTSGVCDPVTCKCVGGTMPILQEAICKAEKSGANMIGPAGNYGDNASKYIPGSYPEVINVASLSDFDGEIGSAAKSTCIDDHDDFLSYYSNTNDTVNIVAPGACIESIHPGAQYASMSGTTMASAHVSGVAALLRATNISAHEVKHMLQNGTCTDHTFNGPHNQSAGVLNAEHCVPLLRGFTGVCGADGTTAVYQVATNASETCANAGNRKMTWTLDTSLIRKYMIYLNDISRRPRFCGYCADINDPLTCVLTNYTRTRIGPYQVCFAAKILSVVSDQRLKKDITPKTPFECFENIKLLRVQQYKYIADETNRLHDGFIAQQVEGVLPYAIDDGGEDGYKSIDYIPIIANLVGAVQYLSSVVNSLQLQQSNLIMRH